MSQLKSLFLLSFYPTSFLFFPTNLPETLSASFSFFRRFGVNRPPDLSASFFPPVIIFSFAVRPCIVRMELCCLPAAVTIDNLKFSRF